MTWKEYSKDFANPELPKRLGNHWDIGVGEIEVKCKFWNFKPRWSKKSNSVSMTKEIRKKIHLWCWWKFSEWWVYCTKFRNGVHHATDKDLKLLERNFRTEILIWTPGSPLQTDSEIVEIVSSAPWKEK